MLLHVKAVDDTGHDRMLSMKVGCVGGQCGTVESNVPLQSLGGGASLKVVNVLCSSVAAAAVAGLENHITTPSCFWWDAYSPMPPPFYTNGHMTATSLYALAHAGEVP